MDCSVYTPSHDEYDEIKKKVDKIREQIVSDEMAYDIRQYIDSIKHDPFWVGRIKNDINKLLVNREYIDFLIQIYRQCHFIKM